MNIWVSSLARVHEIAASARPERIVSLLAKEDAFPALSGYGADRHHKVRVDDIRAEIAGYVAPSGEHVRGLIDFVKAWRRDEPLLVHCWAGISRSTATAFIAACLHNPEADEASIALALRAASPTAFPNTRIVALADDILRRRGRMAAAVEAIGRGDIAEEAEPFFIPGRFE
ncbi:MAG: tyrosine phosphatase family protein [Amphiplicatus sp.]